MKALQCARVFPSPPPALARKGVGEKYGLPAGLIRWLSLEQLA
jgi:hypothetical protein